VGDEGVPFRQIAEAIGVGLGLPVTAVAAGDADAHFGYLAPFVGLDNPTSNERTKALLGSPSTSVSSTTSNAAATSHPRLPRLLG
jgi:hypothetical protein